MARVPSPQPETASPELAAFGGAVPTNRYHKVALLRMLDITAGYGIAASQREFDEYERIAQDGDTARFWDAPTDLPAEPAFSDRAEPVLVPRGVRLLRILRQLGDTDNTAAAFTDAAPATPLAATTGTATPAFRSMADETAAPHDLPGWEPLGDRHPASLQFLPYDHRVLDQHLTVSIPGKARQFGKDEYDGVAYQLNQAASQPLPVADYSSSAFGPSIVQERDDSGHTPFKLTEDQLGRADKFKPDEYDYYFNVAVSHEGSLFTDEELAAIAREEQEEAASVRDSLRNPLRLIENVVNEVLKIRAAARDQRARGIDPDGYSWNPQSRALRGRRRRGFDRSDFVPHLRSTSTAKPVSHDTRHRQAA